MNLRPLEPHSSALPDCATSRHKKGLLRAFPDDVNKKHQLPPKKYAGAPESTLSAAGRSGRARSSFRKLGMSAVSEKSWGKAETGEGRPSPAYPLQSSRRGPATVCRRARQAPAAGPASRPCRDPWPGPCGRSVRTAQGRAVPGPCACILPGRGPGP